MLLANGMHARIDSLRRSDLVMATNPLTGQTAARPVTEVIVGNGLKHLVDVESIPATESRRPPFTRSGFPTVVPLLPQQTCRWATCCRPAPEPVSRSKHWSNAAHTKALTTSRLLISTRSMSAMTRSLFTTRTQSADPVVRARYYGPAALGSSPFAPGVGQAHHILPYADADSVLARRLTRLGDRPEQCVQRGLASKRHLLWILFGTRIHRSDPPWTQHALLHELRR